MERGLEEHFIDVTDLSEFEDWVEIGLDELFEEDKKTPKIISEMLANVLKVCYRFLRWVFQ